MQPSKQLCRYYQRGSCQYGARCKFAHEIEQPSKANNSFGFGVQQNSGSVQQQNNPFGFGPFDNKWSRVSANPGTGAAASPRKGDGQSPAATHSCTDPDSCKKQIAEDFEHERPLWKLTCYSHHKYAPCDITGDVSYEELRMSAYDDAKSGMSLPAIVEKERGLLNAKLVEFEALLRNPYKGPSSSIATQSPFPQATPNAFMNNVASPSVTIYNTWGVYGFTENLVENEKEFFIWFGENWG
uniref:C3H1-type domain-containing protein n=1 Tax=Kalanchoe fedtschenkoi TaxID=63787 RepID=A0A7N0ZSI1_KALFE